MTRTQRSLQIINQSLVTMREHPRLLVFPLLNLAGSVIILVFFIMPVLMDVSIFNLQEDWPAFQERMEQRKAEQEEIRAQRQAQLASPDRSFAGLRQTFSGQHRIDLPFLPMAGIYLVTMFVMTYLNVAFYSEILHAFNGNPVSISRGLAFARSKLQAILLWSLLAGVVGIIIRRIEENVGFVGRLITGLIGITWSVASVFAIPVIIRERQQSNPVAYLKTSASLIKHTWGEGLVGIVSITGSVVLVMFAMFSVVVAIVVAAQSTVLVFIAMPALILVVIALSYLAGMARSIFLCGLYVYATEGVAPGAYDPALMEKAWRVKKR